MSVITYILVSLLSLGVGTLCGFGVLYQQYSHECASLLENSQSQASATFQEQYAALKAELAHCIDQESQLQRQCQDAQTERLKAHSELATQHQTLLREHEGILEKVSGFQSQLEGSTQTVNTLTQERSKLQQELDDAHENCDPKQLEDMQKQLEKPFEAMEQLHNLQSLIQQQYLGELLQEFGENSRPIVEFQISVPNHQTEALASFQVELFPMAYPMTTAIFLKLVSQDLYVGTTIALNRSGSSLVGGNPHKSASTRIQSNLTRQYAVWGFGVEPFLWKEEERRSPNAQQTSTRNYADGDAVLWFPSRSPQFQVTAFSATKDHMPYHGRILRMDESLWKAAEGSGSDQHAMVISSVRVLPPGGKAETFSSDEL